jgi:hypothetical protein
MIGILFAAILILVIFLKKKQPDVNILAQIGDKDISVQEFLRRSELTIRPVNFKSKNSALNNLVSEKILATEAERDHKLTHNPVLVGTIKGIKEQVMRNQLYYEVAYNKVKLDSSEVYKVYQLSKREYELEFYTLHDKELANRISTMIDSLPETGAQVFKELAKTVGQKPVHKVNYKDPEDEVIHEALYTKPLALGTIIGPLRLSDGESIIMKVLNWVDYPLISAEDQQVQWNKVKEKMRQTKANQLWRSYQNNLMQGKKIKFNEPSFKILSSLALKKYLNDTHSDSLQYQLTDLPSAVPAVDANAPFFSIDNTVWTVADFRREVLSHPLVFRTKYINPKNFNHQFQLAIVDLMRDHFLTQDAYQRSLDNLVDVQRTEQLWKDAYLALQFEKNVLDSALHQGLINENDKDGKREYWESYVRTLQGKYSNSIRVNYPALDKISLTTVDMVALQPGVPYPVAVPNFPTIIASGNLDYIKQKKFF